MIRSKVSSGMWFNCQGIEHHYISLNKNLCIFSQFATICWCVFVLRVVLFYVCLYMVFLMAQVIKKDHVAAGLCCIQLFINSSSLEDAIKHLENAKVVVLLFFSCLPLCPQFKNKVVV